MNRRDVLSSLATLGGIAAFPFAVEAGERKPLTTASLATSLLRLADKAEAQGMREEARAIYAAVKTVLAGAKVGG